MARNRKRAKERRARRPQPVASRSRERTARGGVPERIEHEPEAQEELEPVAPEPVEAEPVEAEPVEAEPVEAELVEDDEPDYEAPSPIEHAAPDAEIAEERLQLGALGPSQGERVQVDPELESEDGGRVFDDEIGDAPRGGAGELAVGAPGRAEPRALPGNRVIGFLKGSWRELQRVQWPDRRQVMQATGVVIGFVIVAGVFLGVSDWVAGKVVSFVVNGHF